MREICSYWSGKEQAAMLCATCEKLMARNQGKVLGAEGPCLIAGKKSEASIIQSRRDEFCQNL